MRPQSAKAKGRRLQQWVRDTLLTFCPALTPDDIRSTSMGTQGEDIQLSSAAKLVYPFSIECKNVEKINIFQALEQAEQHATKAYVFRGKSPETLEHIKLCTPIVVFKRNHSKTYVALEFEEFLKLTRKDK